MSERRIQQDGSEAWYNEKDELHREDGPALVRPDGTKEWWLNGQRHRTDGPAIESANGREYWYVNGRLHRTDGPAVVWEDGQEWWYQNGECHRDDGPAHRDGEGLPVYFVHGVKMWRGKYERWRADAPRREKVEKEQAKKEAKEAAAKGAETAKGTLEILTEKAKSAGLKLKPATGKTDEPSRNGR